MRRLRSIMKAILPSPLVNWLRRWLATGRYLRYMSHEVQRRRSPLDRDASLETLEAGLAARRDGFYQQMVREVVERTDLVLQQLDRRLEGQGARHGERLAALEEEMARLREAVEELRATLHAAPPASEGRGGRPGRRGRPSGRPRRRAASE